MHARTHAHHTHTPTHPPTHTQKHTRMQAHEPATALSLPVQERSSRLLSCTFITTHEPLSPLTNHLPATALSLPVQERSHTRMHAHLPATALSVRQTQSPPHLYVSAAIRDHVHRTCVAPETHEILFRPLTSAPRIPPASLPQRFLPVPRRLRLVEGHSAYKRVSCYASSPPLSERSLVRIREKVARKQQALCLCLCLCLSFSSSADLMEAGAGVDSAIWRFAESRRSAPETKRNRLQVREAVWTYVRRSRGGKDGGWVRASLQTVYIPWRRRRGSC